MKYERSINTINRLLERYSLGFMESGVKWVVISGITPSSRYEIREDTIYIHPDDIGWSWAFWPTTMSIMFHELGHRFAEKILNKNVLRQKRVVELFGPYHKKYIRNLPMASRASKKDMFDYPSRYAMVHPADDFAEICTVCLVYITKDRDPEEFPRDYMKSELCRKKITVMLELLNESKEKHK